MLNLKVCGLCHSENIKHIVKLNPAMMGFVFHKNSHRYCLQNDICEDVRIIPKNIKKVGVFVDQNLKEIKSIIDIYKLNMIQLYHKNIKPFQVLRNKVEIIKAINISSENDFTLLDNNKILSDYFLFDTKGKFKGGNGLKFNWQLLNYYNGATPFILSGGIGPADADAINKINHPLLFGVDINSQFEISAGVKNINQIKIFYNKLNSY